MWTGCVEKMGVELGERLATLEQLIKSHDARLQNKFRRIEKIEGNNETLIRLAALAEMQNETSREQSETLSKINENLTSLNLTSNQLQSDIVNIGSRVEDIEKSNQETFINIPGLLTKIVIGIFMLIPTVILSWFLINAGLK